MSSGSQADSDALKISMSASVLNNTLGTTTKISTSASILSKSGGGVSVSGGTTAPLLLNTGGMTS